MRSAFLLPQTRWTLPRSEFARHAGARGLLATSSALWQPTDRTILRYGVAAVVLICIRLQAVGADDSPRFTLEPSEQGITVRVGGELFARYHIQSGTKPILWPIIGPTGKEMTRGYPMRDAIEHEKSDHPHHRSFWFDHGDVNGVSFWHDGRGHGTIVHREFLASRADANGALLRTRNDWMAPDGSVLCQDVRTFRFAANHLQRWIDFDVTVTAMQDEVIFGDTKEGTFGLRVAGALSADRSGGGTIVNSNGQRDDAAWGKPAAWVDYYGNVEGEPVGIAILNHPRSFRFPTYWHVRTYGLFAANPFGLRDFHNGSDVNGALTLKQGESFTLHFRVLLHTGDAQSARIAEAYETYANAPTGSD